MNTKQDTSEESHFHEWYLIKDWEGDPSVINGVNYLYYYRCSICEEEVDTLPRGEYVFDAHE